MHKPKSIDTLYICESSSFYLALPETKLYKLILSWEGQCILSEFYLLKVFIEKFIQTRSSWARLRT